jgi:hypothetical protein
MATIVSDQPGTDLTDHVQGVRLLLVCATPVIPAPSAVTDSSEAFADGSTIATGAPPDLDLADVKGVIIIAARSRPPGSAVALLSQGMDRRGPRRRGWPRAVPMERLVGDWLGAWRSGSWTMAGEHVSGASREGLGVVLERAEGLRVLEESLAGVRASGEGRLVLLGGEAGGGKTALLRWVCESRGG